MILHLAIGGASLFGADRVSLLRFSRTFDELRPLECQLEPYNR
jgi:hypothetical protein